MLFVDNKYKPLDFDYLLLKQVFITSMMPTDPVLSISIGDLVDIYNILVQNRETRWIPADARHKEFPDPLSKLRSALGDQQIELG